MLASRRLIGLIEIRTSLKARACLCCCCCLSQLYGWLLARTSLIFQFISLDLRSLHHSLAPNLTRLNLRFNGATDQASWSPLALASFVVWLNSPSRKHFIDSKLSYGMKRSAAGAGVESELEKEKVLFLGIQQKNLREICQFCPIFKPLHFQYGGITRQHTNSLIQQNDLQSNGQLRAGWRKSSGLYMVFLGELTCIQ